MTGHEKLEPVDFGLVKQSNWQLAVLHTLRTARRTAIVATCTMDGVTDEERQLGERLVSAAGDGKFNLVQELIEQGAPVNYVSERGPTATYAATNFDIIRYLVEHGGDPDFFTPCLGMLPAFSLLCLCQPDGAFQLFMLGFGEPSHLTPPDFHLMCCIPSLGQLAVEITIARGVDVGIRWNEGGDTPLFSVLRDRRPSHCHQALIACGADVNAVNVEGDTPALIACGRLQYKDLSPQDDAFATVRYLVMRGAWLSCSVFKDMVPMEKRKRKRKRKKKKPDVGGAASASASPSFSFSSSLSSSPSYSSSSCTSSSSYLY